MVSLNKLVRDSGLNPSAQKYLISLNHHFLVLKMLLPILYIFLIHFFYSKYNKEINKTIFKKYEQR